MARSNLPTSGLDDVSAEFAHDAIKSLNELNKLGRPESDDDVERRIDEYFRFCEKSSLRPGVESLGLALSVSRTAIWNWEHGINCSKRRQELIVKAKLFITSYIEQCMLNNKMYPGSAIFMLKNWAGYRDAVEVDSVQHGNNPAMSQEEIKMIVAGVESSRRDGESEGLNLQELLDGLPDE